MAQDRELEPRHEEPGERTAPVAQPDVPETAAIKALRALFAKGEPEPKQVVAILDAHRSERAAILAFLHAHAGNAYVAKVMAATEHLRLHVDRREVVAGDPSDPDSGYFIGSAEERGARWRTGDGRFTGRADNHGLDARYAVDPDTAVHLGVDPKTRTGVLGLEEGGENVGEVAARYRSGDDWDAGVRRPFALDGGATLTPGFRHQRRPELGSADVAALGYRDPTTTGEVYAGYHEGGGVAAGLSGSHAFDARTAMSGSMDYSPDMSRLSLSGHHRATDELTLSGGMSHTERRHGPDVTALGLSERYRSGDLVHGLDLSLEHGERDTFRSTGSVDAALAPNLYGGAFGRYERTTGQDPTAAIGASLTITPHEKAALTLAGIIDERGNFETRLQLDVFKKRIESVQALADNKKSALVSLFISYTQGTRHDLLDDRYGAGQLNRDIPAGAGQIGAGIRIRF